MASQTCTIHMSRLLAKLSEHFFEETTHASKLPQGQRPTWFNKIDESPLGFVAQRIHEHTSLQTSIIRDYADRMESGRTLENHWLEGPDVTVVNIRHITDEMRELDREGFTHEVLTELREKFPDEFSQLGLAGGRKSSHRCKRNRGRPQDTDEAEDKRIYDAWKTGRYRKYADLAAEKAISPPDVKRAIDRHRKRLIRTSS